MTDEDTGADRTIPPEAKERLRQAGTAAGQGLFGVLIFAVIFTITGALGFLVYRGAIESGPFLLAVGILLGFFLGHVNAVAS